MSDWRLRLAYQADTTRVFVVESVQLMPNRSGRTCHLVATLEPQAIVVASGSVTTTFDLDGATVTPATLARQFEGIDAAVARALT